MSYPKLAAIHSAGRAFARKRVSNISRDQSLGQVGWLVTLETCGHTVWFVTDPGRYVYCPECVARRLQEMRRNSMSNLNSNSASC